MNRLEKLRDEKSYEVDIESHRNCFGCCQSSREQEEAFKQGWNACAGEYDKIIADLESLQYNNPNVRQDAYNKGVLDCINRFKEWRGGSGEQT